MKMSNIFSYYFSGLRDYGGKLREDDGEENNTICVQEFHF